MSWGPYQGIKKLMNTKAAQRFFFPKLLMAPSIFVWLNYKNNNRQCTQAIHFWDTNVDISVIDVFEPSHSWELYLNLTTKG